MLNLSKKGDLKRVLMILIAGLLLFIVFAGWFAFAETPEEEKARIEEIKNPLNVFEAGL